MLFTLMFDKEPVRTSCKNRWTPQAVWTSGCACENCLHQAVRIVTQTRQLGQTAASCKVVRWARRACMALPVGQRVNHWAETTLSTAQADLLWILFILNYCLTILKYVSHGTISINICATNMLQVQTVFFSNICTTNVLQVSSD